VAWQPPEAFNTIDMTSAANKFIVPMLNPQVLAFDALCAKVRLINLDLSTQG
jgi:hypothetical protein